MDVVVVVVVGSGEGRDNVDRTTGFVTMRQRMCKGNRTANGGARGAGDVVGVCACVCEGDALRELKKKKIFFIFNLIFLRFFLVSQLYSSFCAHRQLGFCW